MIKDKELEKYDSNEVKIVPLYMYFNSRYENSFTKFFKNELFYSLYPFFKDEYESVNKLKENYYK